jgi:glyoxylase-like metal-dependent hydrolase (beta-lactamase superfamily II)
MVTEIGDRTWRLESQLGGRNVFQYLLASEDGDELLLVDTGTSATPHEVVLPALRRLGLAPEALRLAVVTHSDLDHQGGLAALLDLCPNALSACGFADRPMVGRPEQLIRDRYQPYLREHGLGYDAGEERWMRAYYGAPVEIDVTLSGGERLRVGERTLEALHAPGHSAGHLALYERETGRLFSSDAVHWSGCPGADGVPALCPTYEEVDPYLATIEMIEELAPGELHSGHWPARSGAEVAEFLAESRAFVERVDAVVLARLDEGDATLAELCEAVQRDTGPWRSEPGMLRFAVHGHLRRLVRRGEVASPEPTASPRRYARAALAAEGAASSANTGSELS